MAGETNEADDDDETDGRTDDEPRAEDVPRGAGVSAIDECQGTTKVVEEYEPAQTGPSLQVVRDRSDHLRHENLGEVGHGPTVFNGAAGRKTDEIWAVDETFTSEVSNARVNTGDSSVHDHDRTNEDATEEGGNGGEDKESLPPNSPWSLPFPPAAPRNPPSPTPNKGETIRDDTGNGDYDGEPQARQNDGDESGDEDGQESVNAPADSTSPQDAARPVDDEDDAREAVKAMTTTPRPEAPEEAAAAKGAQQPPKRRHCQGGASLRAKTASARWLQNWWRRLRSMQSAVSREDGRVWPGDWRRCSPWIRSRTNPRCLSQGIAGVEDFEKQAELAAGVVMWYQQYVRILRRLSGRTPVAVSGFCGAGGTDEGIRRCGGASVGFHAVYQPHFVSRFGAERFSVGDGTTASAWRSAAGNH